MQKADDADLPAELLQRYRVEEPLGSGAFGTVYRATRLRTGAVRAIKVVPKRVHWERELEIMQLLRHPHVLRLHCYVEVAERCCLVLEYCAGGDLLAHITKQPRGRLDEAEAKRLAAQLLGALEYCQGNLVAHRDLKAENVLLDAAGNIKLADFGLAKQTKGSTETLVGSPWYSAIELHGPWERRGRSYNPLRSDAWSFGVLLATMVQGCFPFRVADEHALAAALATQRVPPLSRQTIDKAAPSLEYAALIDKLLVPPEQRLPLDRIKFEPWLGGYLVDHGLPPRRALEPDAALLDAVAAIGFDRADAEAAVRDNRPCAAHAVYHLLAEDERALQRQNSMPQLQKQLQRLSVETRSTSADRLQRKARAEADSPSPLHRLMARRAERK